MNTTTTTNITKLNITKQLEAANQLWLGHHRAREWEQARANELKATRRENLEDGIGELQSLNLMIDRHLDQVAKHNAAMALLSETIEELQSAS